MKKRSPEVATFAAGCFWCVEAVFRRLRGVLSVVPGYTGGKTPQPTYEEVCTESTGHAEACEITFEASKIRYEKLLEVFWKTHDPTTRNRQGKDVGTQYRSAIFFHNDRQKRLAEKVKKKLDASGAFDSPLVTEIVPGGPFTPAEPYHHNYFALNPDQAYCQVIIRPKIEEFEAVFKTLLRKCLQKR